MTTEIELLPGAVTLTTRWDPSFGFTPHVESSVVGDSPQWADNSDLSYAHVHKISHAVEPWFGEDVAVAPLSPLSIDPADIVGITVYVRASATGGTEPNIAIAVSSDDGFDDGDFVDITLPGFDTIYDVTGEIPVEWAAPVLEGGVVSVSASSSFGSVKCYELRIVVTLSDCGTFYPAIRASLFDVSGESAGTWFNADVSAPGTFQFAGAEVVADPSAVHYLRFHVNEVEHGAVANPPISDTSPLDPLIPAPETIVAMAVQVKFPSDLPSDPDTIVVRLGAIGSDPEEDGYFEIISPVQADTTHRQLDGSWLIPIPVDSEIAEATLAGLVSGFNDPPPHQVVEGVNWYYEAPFAGVHFGWSSGGTDVALSAPFEMAGIWFYTCLPDEEPPEPEPSEISVAPPLRIYPRHDQSAMGTPRVFPKSPSQQHGNRVGPGSYT